MTDTHSYLDEYKITKKIGTGYSADVYSAQYNDRKFAIKIFKEDASDFAEGEFQSAKQLLHPNIIDYEEYKREACFKNMRSRGNRQAIIMELATNGQIFDLVEECKGFTEIIARTYFHMLIDALEYIHDCGVAHLDIKAENLLLDQNYVLKVSDFGFSSGRGDKIYRKIGTEGYMSPDIENGEGFYGEEADIFAAGVVLFILTTGFQPFKSTRPEDPHYRALNASSNRFWQTYKSKKLSEKFRDLIQRMLSEEPDERLSIEQIKQHPWYCEDILMTKDLTSAINKLRANS